VLNYYTFGYWYTVYNLIFKPLGDMTRRIFKFGLTCIGGTFGLLYIMELNDLARPYFREDIRPYDMLIKPAQGSYDPSIDGLTDVLRLEKEVKQEAAVQRIYDIIPLPGNELSIAECETLIEFYAAHQLDTTKAILYIENAADNARLMQ